MSGPESAVSGRSFLNSASGRSPDRWSLAHTLWIGEPSSESAGSTRSSLNGRRCMAHF